MRKFWLGINLVALGLISCVQNTQPTSSAAPASGEKDQSESTKSEEGASAIEEPVSVGGAFLVCAKDETITQKDGHVAAGCRIADKDKNPITLPEDINSQLEVYDPFNSPIASNLIQKMPVGGKWNWQIYVPKVDAWTNESLVKFVKNSAEVGGASTAVDLRTAAAASEIASVTLGVTHDYVLGSTPSNCAAEAGNDQVDAGDTLVVPFYFSNIGTQKVAITIKDYCFETNSSTSLSIQLKKGGSLKYEKTFTSDAGPILIPGTVMEAGIYHLVISRNKGSVRLNHINFIVSKSMYLGIGKPVFKEADAPQDTGVTPTNFLKEDSNNILTPNN